MNYKNFLRYWCIVPSKKQRHDDWCEGTNNPFANNITPITSSWQAWYAWRPVLLDNDKWCWLQSAYRRRYYSQSNRRYYWAYGDEFDYLKDF